MYEKLIEIIGITPETNPLGFIACLLILIWFIYQMFGIIYWCIKGK